MGTTETKMRPSLDREYKLIRRFVSDLYESSEVTVIQHKQTKQQFVLKELIQQFSSQKIIKDLQMHRSHTHSNLIALRRYWIENDVNICSSLFKIYAVFDHHQTNLEEWLEENRGEVSDKEGADFVKQMVSVLTFLERNRVVYLLGGPKSIAVAHENKIIGINKATPSQDSTTEAHRNCPGRFSLGGQQLWNCQDLKPPSRKQSCNTILQPSQKRIYKIFDPFDRGTASRSSLNLSNYLQVPAHPSLATYNENIAIPDATIKQQNMLTIGIIALSMCQGVDFVELDIYKKGRLSLQKYNNRIANLKQKFPKTYKEMQKCQCNPLHTFNYPVRMSQFFKIKDVSLLRQRKESKENVPCQNGSLQRSWKLSSNKKNQRSVVGLVNKTSSKRVSLAEL